jgi:hypothetical protein
MRQQYLLALIGLVSAPIAFGSLKGQESAAPLTGRAMGVSMDRFAYESSDLVAFSYRFSDLRPGGLGAELGASLFPQALPAGVLVLAPDLGAAYNITIPGGSLLIKGGASAITALGTTGFLMVPGLHIGGTLIIQTGSRSGLRVDMIRHYYRGGEVQPIWSIGLGFAVIPRVAS